MRRLIATGASMSLTTSYVRRLVAIPDDCDLGLVSIEMSSIVTGVAVTWYLSRDSAGDQPITPLWTDTILDAGSGSAYGSVVRDMSDIMNHAQGGTGVYVNAKLDAGTATGTPRIGYRVDA